MTVEKRGISVIVVKQASICHWLEVPNRQGNYPFTYLMSLIVYEVNLLMWHSFASFLRSKNEAHERHIKG